MSDRSTIVRAVRRAAESAAHSGRRLACWLSGGRRVLPDYLIIGAQKGGTTSLHRYLLQHPDIAPSLRKEVHYFDLHFSRGEAWYRAFFPSERAVRAHEEATGRRLLTGEATPFYLFHPLAPARAARVVTSARLIALLRDPVERAYSHYRHEVRRGRETLSFREAIEREAERLAREREAFLGGHDDRAPHHRRHSYVARGLYAEQLRRWLRYFPPDRILILGSEAFFAAPQLHLDRVCRFLGLPPHPAVDFPVHNPGERTAPMDPDVRAMLREFFREPNRELALLTGIDFGWDLPRTPATSP